MSTENGAVSESEQLLAVAANIVNTYADQAPPAAASERNLQGIAKNTAMGGGAGLAFLARAKGIFDLESNLAKIDHLNQSIGTASTKQGLCECVDLHSEWEFMQNVWKKLGFTSTAEMKKQLDMVHAEDLKQFQAKYQAELLTAQKEMANNSMYWAVASAFVVALSQAIQLVAIWSDVSAASNLIDDQVEKAKMRAQLDHLIQELGILEKSVEAWKALPSGRNKEKAFLGLQRELNKVNSIQQKAFNAIDNMKFKINGHITKLGNHQTTLAVNGISTALHLVLTAVQLGSSYGLLGTAAKALGWTGVVLLGAVEVGNIGTYIMTTKKINALRQVLQQYKLLDLELTGLTLRISEIQAWADNQNFDEM